MLGIGKLFILTLFGGACVGAPTDRVGKTRTQADRATDILRNRQKHLHVIGGRPAHPATWRFVVAVEAELRGFICAGSLVTWDAVLTTVHCVDGINEPIIVKVGVYDRDAGDELDIIAVAKIDKHEKYKQEDSQLNDIAVLHLERQTHLRPPLVTRATLPREGGDYTQHDDCFMVGWGRTDLNSSSMSPVLTEKHIGLIDHCECQDRWDQSLFKPRVYKTNICVDDEEGTVSACQGDSGSPVGCVDEGDFVVVGLSSWGSAACHTYPSVYTDITDYVTWIIDKITEIPLDLGKQNKTEPKQGEAVQDNK